ncbi:MAG: cell division protein FtsZ, partial [Candidatus Colwellbacteria bacterium]|nr:cell division protein FtsZ [Candidatus Colwellbacteria bacterium]
MAKKKRRTTRKKKTAAKVTRRPRKIKKKAVVRKKTKAAKISRPASSTRLSKAIKAVKAALPKKRAHRRARRKIAQQSSSRGKHFVRIKVIGIGGGGGNAITRMRRDFHARGVEFVVINTDLQDLESCDASRKLHIGRALTKGMGAGMNPELGQQSAEENRSEIAEVLQGADMVFLTAGFGGGTGTGATPVVAEVAREMGILTAAIVTKPFAFEGAARGRIAEDGLTRMKGKVDTLLIIPNDRIFNIIDKNTPVVKAFEKIDDILKSAVQGVAEIITASGLINVDFADVRSVMTEAGLAVIGVGYGGGADRAVKAIGEAINSPLLDISIEGARSVLFGVAGGRDLKMTEINEAAKIITDAVDPEAKIIFGAYNDRKLKNGQIKVIIIATGFNGMAMRREEPLNLFNVQLEPMADSLSKLPEPNKRARIGRAGTNAETTPKTP